MTSKRTGTEPRSRRDLQADRAPKTDPNGTGPSTQPETNRNVGPAGVAPAASMTSTPRLAHSASKAAEGAGGLGLEPRLHGSKGRRAADYPIPHGMDRA